MRFNEFPFHQRILDAIDHEGHIHPTPIQQLAIPPVLSGQDVLGCAQTGTGKTAAFALPILQHLAFQSKTSRGSDPIRALVLTPTRELAAQVGESFKAYGRNLKTRTAVIFGGVSQVTQERELGQGPEVLVATPGRLLDLIKQRIISLAAVEIFVLDEADRMLDMGFIHDIRNVVAYLPKKRQSLFFSATMPADIRELADSILGDNPVFAAADPPASTVELIEQRLCFVERQDKISLLIHFLSQPSVQRALVFTRTKHGADKVVRKLKRAGIAGQAIHGNKSQTARTKALSGFKSGRTPVLVATDIAARGIDVEEITHVFNFDLPNEPETYVHRIGRTGRAGAPGIAIAFCAEEERPYLRDIEKLLKNHIPRDLEHPYGSPLPPPEPTELMPARPAPRSTYAPRNNYRRQSAGAGRDRRRGERGAGTRNSGPGRRDVMRRP
ncbi:DEAD/DEAH box helicase [bacterium]|nr:DEAD/DEAH box helicase [candidate division CSSED10-310 bacterium]